jgi:hypothetical protein
MVFLKKKLPIAVILGALVVSSVILRFGIPPAAKAPVPTAQAQVQVQAPPPQAATSSVKGVPVIPPKPEKPKPVPPDGKQTFQITQAAGVWPKIVQATIDPPNVHVGDVQKLSVVVESPVGIASVTATIKTDHKTITVPLELVGPTPTADILSERYYIDGNNKLAFVGNGSVPVAEKSGAYVAEAAEPPALTYAASWTVEDTHNITYHTTFVVKDNFGTTNSVTLAWSDACGIPQGGNWTMTTSCSLSSNDGVDNGSATIQSGTLTIPNGVSFAFNSGQHITISSGGSIAVASGGQLYKAYIFWLDADGDGWAQNTTMYFKPSPSYTYYVRRYAAYGSTDCNDYDPTIWNLNGFVYYTDADGDGYGDPNTSNETYACSNSAPALPAGYVYNGSDCYDHNANAYPGSSFYSWQNRGDGSFDYNCDGWPTQMFSTYSCTDQSTNTCNSPIGCGAPCHYHVGVYTQGVVPACGQGGYPSSDFINNGGRWGSVCGPGTCASWGTSPTPWYQECY